MKFHEINKDKTVKRILKYFGDFVRLNLRNCNQNIQQMCAWLSTHQQFSCIVKVGHKHTYDAKHAYNDQLQPHYDPSNSSTHAVNLIRSSSVYNSNKRELNTIPSVLSAPDFYTTFLCRDRGSKVGLSHKVHCHLYGVGTFSSTYFISNAISNATFTLKFKCCKTSWLHLYSAVLFLWNDHCK